MLDSYTWNYLTVCKQMSFGSLKNDINYEHKIDINCLLTNN